MINPQTQFCPATSFLWNLPRLNLLPNKINSMTALISHVHLNAAHEGIAELIVTLTFENGGRSQVPLDPNTSSILMSRCQASDLSELIGQDWTHIRDALTESFNSN